MLGKIFWIALTAAFTICWLALFDYGPHDYCANVQREWEDARAFFGHPVEHPSKRPMSDAEKAVHF